MAHPNDRSDDAFAEIINANHCMTYTLKKYHRSDIGMIDAWKELGIEFDRIREALSIIEKLILPP